MSFSWAVKEVKEVAAWSSFGFSPLHPLVLGTRLTAVQIGKHGIKTEDWTSGTCFMAVEVQDSEYVETG